MWLLATSQFHFIFSRVEVCQEIIFFYKSNEGGRTVTSAVVDILLNFNEKNLFFAFYLCYSLCSTSEVLLVLVLV
jgi:hypothetical protein